MIRIDEQGISLSLRGNGWKNWCAAALCAVGVSFSIDAASAQTRSLKLYNVHTGEKAEIVYRRGGSYDSAGLKKINYFLRDWRKNQPTRMNPKVLDVLWEVHRNTGASGYINIICGYRSPATNSMLRSRSKGVAKKSQHTLGNAIDFYIPGVKLKTIRNAGLALQAGGVGYYPSSGSPFVHMDVGRVRHWGPISDAEVAMAMKSGKRFSSKGGTVTAFNSDSGNKSPGLLARLFGGGADEEEDNAESEAPVAKKPAKPVVVKKPLPVDTEVAAPAIKVIPPEQAAPAQPGIKIVPPEEAMPAQAPVVPEPPVEVIETPETIIAALPARKVPMPLFAPRPQVDVGPVETTTESETATQLVAAIERPETAVPVAAVDAAGGPADTEAAGGNLVADELRAGEAVAAIPAERPTDVALGIPLPTWRPKNAPAPAVEADSTALLALASTGDAGDILSDAPAVPSQKPDAIAGNTTAEMTGTIPVASPAKPTRVALAKPVKTTQKGARPTKLDSKPDPKPVVVAAQPQDARWAIDKDYIAKGVSGTKAPSYAYKIVRTAPLEVYTAGFQQAEDQEDVNRFSGKAVKFLQVARFQEKK